MTAETEDDEALQAFFDEVDKLSINDNGDMQSSAAADSDTGENKATKRDDVVNTNSKNEKKHVIANAKHNQKAWSEFKMLDLSKDTSIGDGSGGGINDKDNKISFQISRKKKKKKVKQPPNNVDVNNTTDTALPINETSTSHSHDCPSWTLILDTCSLLQQNGIHSIQKLIELAHFAITNNTNQTTNQLHTPLYEPIRIVIPYVVWGELDYISKKMNKNNNNSLEEGEVEKNETNASIARRAIRMLRDELELSQQINRADIQGSVPSNILPSRSGVIHSQSLVESNKAANRYLSKDLQSTNDDYILACALKENENYKQFTAGGVVVITLDNNLSCKALANDLKVHSPSSFVDYYEKRMESLKQRTTVGIVAVQMEW